MSDSSSVNKLHIPRHSYNTSVTSVSSGIPALMATRSVSSILKLSRVNTGTGESGLDSQSVRANDRVATAKPNVTYSDKLWTQIDVLDDVKRMSEEVRQKGSFFNESFATELSNLKASQNRLLNAIAANKLERTDDSGNLESFFDNSELSKMEMKRKHEFAEMNAYMDEVKSSLDDVVVSMKRFGETTKEMW